MSHANEKSEGRDVQESADAMPWPENRSEGIEEMARGVQARVNELTAKEGKLKRLAERRESGELSPYDFDLNWIYQLQRAGMSLARKDLNHQTGIQAVVLTPEDMETLGGFDYIAADGTMITVEPEDMPAGDVLILYPEDLGDEEA